MAIKYLSLFSGIGGFELGIQNAYVETIKGGADGGGESHPASNENQGQGLEPQTREAAQAEAGQPGQHVDGLDKPGQPHCVGYSEIDKYAIQIYEKHFKHQNYGDITKIDAEKLPEFDILVGGFPCQSFSIAGKRGGFDDTRGTLFFDIARILAAKRPKLFLLENVKGLLSHDGGRTLATILATIDGLGYDAQWQVLNSKNFGVPQNRERVYIVGHIRGEPRPQVFPFEGISGQNLRELTTGTDEASRIYDPAGIARTIKNGGGQGAKTGLYKQPGGVRRLTPTECERLQGFPDGWTARGGSGEIISDAQRYKTIGNAVTSNVVKEIFKKLIKYHGIY